VRLNNYSKGNKKYKHITLQERDMIERWYNKEGKSKREIAKLLNKSDRTIRREINRGLVIVRGYEWEEIEEYSAYKAQEAADYNKTSKGPALKLDQDKKLVKRIEKEILVNKKSPEAIVAEIKDGEYKVKVCARTIRNAIKIETVFDITSKDMIYNKSYKNKNKEKRVSVKIPPEKSIEFRPNEANDRSIYGHWEGDLLIGKRKRGAVLLTLTERRTRQEIIVKLKNKTNEEVVKAFNGLERKYKRRFNNIFKTITFDNGSEFLGYEAIEKSCLRKGNRTSIYYAHPYCAGERGTNENANRMIRRWVPKGTDISLLSKEFIQGVEDWLNNYPRAMFGYKSSNMILLEQ